MANFVPGTYEFIATRPGLRPRPLPADVHGGHAGADRDPLRGRTGRPRPGRDRVGSGAAVISATARPATAPAGARPADRRHGGDRLGGRPRPGAASRTSRGAQVTVDLAGPQPRTINRVQVSAMLGPVFDPASAGESRQNRFTALRQFEILACNAPVADCTPSRLRPVYTSPPTRSRRTRRGRVAPDAAAARVRHPARSRPPTCGSSCATTSAPAGRRTRASRTRIRSTTRTATRPARRRRGPVRAAELQAFGQTSLLQAG